jgi:hypothetical protein
VSIFKREHGIPASAFVIGRIGQPLLSKWSWDTLRGFERFASRHADAYLLVAGTPPELVEGIRRCPAPVRQRIRHIPFLASDTALRTCYAAMDLFLHTSAIGESFGMVLAEAMLCGTPVVTLSTPLKDNSQIEIVAPGVGGFAVATLHALDAALEHLYSNPAERRRLAITGAESVRRRFDTPSVTATLCEISRLLLSFPRQELGGALRSAGIVTSVDTREVGSILEQCIGKTPRITRAILPLIHNPYLYRAWRAVSGHPIARRLRNRVAS